jgi:HSP20 family protein
MNTAEFKSLFPMLKTTDTLNEKLLDHFWLEGDRIAKSYDVTQDENSWSVEISFPGFEKDQIDITVSESGKMIIESEKRNKWTASKKFEFKLSESADLNSVQAEMKNGILKIMVPKRKTMERKTIKIK